jgi:hypothetical protein
MSAILRLYPRAWRERYGDEIVALLEEHPASPLDHLDLIRGAFDARLHPQVPGADVVPEQETPMARKQLGLIAAIGGIVWILGVASIFVLPRGADGYRTVWLASLGLALAIAFIGIALGELGTREGSETSRRTGRRISVVSVVLALALPMVWPIFMFGLFGFPIVAAMAAGRGARNGVFPGWIGIVFTAAAFSVLGGIGIDAEAGNDQSLVILAVVGLPALLLAWLAFRGRSASATPMPMHEPA